MPFAELKRAGAALLEERALDGSLGRLFARAWTKGASIARPLELPPGVVTIGVGGATLGGSYRTPVSIALTQRLANAAPTVLVSHCYGARLRRARFASPDDSASEVGDEALLAARALQGVARVAVGPSRQEALDEAARSGAHIVVFDGLLQARPHPVDFAVLAVDAERPWGSGEVPPIGDLRAPAADLVAEADALVAIAHDGAAPITVPCAHRGSMRLTRARDLVTGETVSLEALRSLRVGLSTSIARPDRVRRALAAYGIEPSPLIIAADHAPPTFPPTPGLDAWLITEKCAAWLSHLVGHSERARLPRVLVLEAALHVPSLFAFVEDAVLDRLGRQP